jgi:hypothetical protein
MAVAPMATNRSLAIPSAGLAVIPDMASDPPQTEPTDNADGGIGSRRAVAEWVTNSASAGAAADTTPSVPRWSDIRKPFPFM